MTQPTTAQTASLTFGKLEDAGIVRGSHGEVTISMATGQVAQVVHDSDDLAYADIERFDLDEYFAHYPNESRAHVHEFDVLDLGFWVKDGAYVPASADFREEIARDLAASATLKGGNQ